MPAAELDGPSHDLLHSEEHLPKIWIYCGRCCLVGRARGTPVSLCRQASVTVDSRDIFGILASSLPNPVWTTTWGSGVAFAGVDICSRTWKRRRLSATARAVKASYWDVPSVSTPIALTAMPSWYSAEDLHQRRPALVGSGAHVFSDWRFRPKQQ